MSSSRTRNDEVRAPCEQRALRSPANPKNSDALEGFVRAVRADALGRRRRAEVDARHHLEFSELESYHKADVEADSSSVSDVGEVRAGGLSSGARV